MRRIRRERGRKRTEENKKVERQNGYQGKIENERELSLLESLWNLNNLSYKSVLNGAKYNTGIKRNYADTTPTGAHNVIMCVTSHQRIPGRTNKRCIHSRPSLQTPYFSQVNW